MYASSDRHSIDADGPPTVTPMGLIFCMQPAYCNDLLQYTKDIIDVIYKSHNAPVPVSQCTIQNRNLHISVLNGVSLGYGALWD